MGTNFYAVDVAEEVRLHIGKRSAAGYGITTFLFQSCPTYEIYSWQDWYKFFINNLDFIIVDDYGIEHSLSALVRIVQSANDTVTEYEYTDDNGYAFCMTDFS